MKHLFTICLSLCIALTGLNAQIILAENFDIDLGPFTESGGGGLGWFSGVDVDFFGGLSSIDGTNMAFVDDDANGDLSPAFTSFLTSPVIDLTIYDGVRLEFDYNFLSFCGTEYFAVEAFDGSTWQQVFLVDEDDCGFWGCDFVTGAYPHANIDLSPYINSAFQFRFIYDDGAGCWGYWIAVDNVVLYQPPPNDVGVTEILAPQTGCSLTSAETISVSVSNLGTDDQSGFDMYYSVNGVVTGPEIFPGVLAGGATQTFDFTTPADLGAVGFYTLEAWTDLPGDAIPGNDASTSDVESIVSVSAPYLQTFDGGFFDPPGWFNNPFDGGFEDWFYNSGSLFVFGTGPDADHTSGFGIYAYASDYGDQDRVELLSPCIDVSALFSPYLSFWYHSREANDGLFPDFVNTLHVDIQSGGVWFNDVITPIGTELFDWQQMEIDLAPYGSNLRVRFRANTNNGWFEHFIAIDDFEIFDKAPVDVGVTEVLSPESACGLSSAESISVNVRNFGTIDQSGFNIAYRVNGGAISSEPYVGTLLAGANETFTFSSTADFSAEGIFLIESWTDLAGDLATYNDSVSSAVENVPLVNSFPYFENFESGQGGWTIINESFSSWQFGSPAGPNINTPSVPGSVNSFMTNLTGNHNNSERGYVLSPCFDFSSLSAPEILLDINWFCEGNYDGANIQYTLDNGGSWFGIGFVGSPTSENWYTNSSLFGLVWAGFQEGWSNAVFGVGSGGWVRAKEDINFLGGEPAVRFRMVFGSDGSVIYDGVAWDNILIRDKPDNDLAVIDIIAPSNSCALGSSENLVIQIENEGLLPQSGFPVRYRVNGGTVVTETFTGTIPALTTANYTFSTTIDMSMLGDYIIEAWTALAGDEATFNDSISDVITNIVSISSFPYTENFEIPGHGWTSGGVASSWELGLPAGAVILPGTTTGSNSWVTNLDGAYNNSERSYVLSPCLDFSSMANPAVGMDIWWEIESGTFFGPADGAILQYSLDGGSTWQRVGNFGDPGNWYNYSSISSAPGDEPPPAPGWSGTASSGDGSGTWLRAQHLLDGLAGLPSVRLRIAFSSDDFGVFDGFAFDNFGIKDAPAPDLGPDTAFCIGESVVLSPGISGSTYVWNTGATTPTITVSTSGTYWVRVTDSDNFSGIDSIVVAVIEEPIVNLGLDRDFCDGAVLDAGNPGFLYLWNTGATTQTINVDVSGNYSVTVNVPVYGCPVTDDVNLVIISQPTASFLWTSTGTTGYFFDASPQATSWSWTFGDGGTSSDRDPVHVYSAPGIYDVTLVASNECGSTTFSLQVEVVASGIDEVLGSAVNLFPNPAQDWVQINGTYSGDGELEWLLYDASGRLLKVGSENLSPGSWNFTIDLSTIAEGAYLLEMRSGTEQAMFRVFKQ